MPKLGSHHWIHTHLKKTKESCKPLKLELFHDNLQGDYFDREGTIRSGKQTMLVENCPNETFKSNFFLIIVTFDDYTFVKIVNIKQ